MQNLILNLFFAGAIAFVPNSTSAPEEMTAYLLKGSHASCAHYPLLSFELAKGATCEGGPKNGGKCEPLSKGETCCAKYILGETTPEELPLCICRLANTDIILDPPSQRKIKKIRPNPGTRLPQDRGDEGDFAWLLRVANMNSPASRIKSWADIKEPKADRPVIARMMFGWDAAQSCHVDQNYVLGEGVYEINKFEFVSIDYPPTPKSRYGNVSGQNLAFSAKSEHEQVLAEGVTFSAVMPVQPVRIILRDLDSPEEDIILKLDCINGKCADVLVSNEILSGHCKDEEFGLHFADYYQLSRAVNIVQVIPHRKRDLVTVPEEFSCGPTTSSDGQLVHMQHPLSRIRRAVASDLRKLLLADFPSLDPNAPQRLLEEIRIFGAGSGELAEVLDEASKRASPLNLKKLDADEKNADLSRIDFINAAIEAVSSRVICPMAMFDP